MQLGGSGLVVTGHSLSSEDVLIGGDLEVDGISYFDGQASFSNTVLINNDIWLGIGNSTNMAFKWDLNSTNDNLGILHFIESNGTEIPGLVTSDASWAPDGDSKFDDITEPFHGFVDDDADSYFRIGFITDDGPGIVTDGDDFTISGGDLHSTQPTEVLDADDVLGVAQSGLLSVFRPITAKRTSTLPSAAAGLIFDYFIADTDSLLITTASGDSLITSAGVAWKTTSSVAGTITMKAMDATRWIMFNTLGTWTSY